MTLVSLSIFLPLGTGKQSLAQETEQNVSLEEVIKNTQELLGQTVSVRGETEEVDSGTTFILSSEQGVFSVFGEDEVLVININNQPSTLPKNDADVQITGQVTEFVREDIELEYGLDLDPELYAEYELKPAIIATSIALAPEPGEVTKEPQAYYDKKVAIEGKVKNIVGTNVFTLDEDQLIDGSDLIVVDLINESLPTADEEVLIMGTIRPYAKGDLERDYDLAWDSEVQEKIEAEYSKLPVLILDSIQSLAE
ncbi:MAG: hypothetical protein AAFQ80_17475 [Cyanobacteria bacterium J06621_8]